MYAVGRLGSYIQRGVYRVSDPFHPFGGAVDIIVVQQEDGSFRSSRWNVRFGKFQGVLKAKERIVRISVNGVEADFNMYLDHKGEAYFLQELDVEEGESLMHLKTSSGDDTDDCSQKKKRAFNSKSCNFEARMSNSADQFDVDRGKVLNRSGSGRSGILGFVFGRRSMKASEYNEGDGGPALTRVDSLERAEIAADLLEVKWSTNLTGLRPQKKISSGFCASVNTEKNSTTNVGNVDSAGNVCSNKEQVGFSAESSFQDFDGFVRETISLSTSDQVVEDSEVGGNMSELIGEVSEDTDAHPNRLGLHNPSVELEYCPDKHLVEKKDSSENIVGLPAIAMYSEFMTDDTALFIHSKPLESSNRGMQCPAEVTNLASERFRSIHIHNEVFHTSAILPQVTHTEECDPQKGQKDGPENNSLQTDITCSCVSDFNDADTQSSPTSTKLEIINLDHCVSSSSDFSNMCYEILCRNDERDIVIPNIFGSPLKSANDYGRTESILKPPSISSEENFIFGDLDEYKIVRGQCTNSFSSEQVDGDNSPSSLDATEKNSQLNSTIVCLPSSCENFVQESEITDQENFRVRSIPIHIQRNHSLDGGLVEQCTGSLPVMSSYSCNLSQHDIHHPRSLSADLQSKSFSWELHGKCLGGDEDKEKQFINDRHTKDMEISGMVNTIGASPTVEISLCKHLLSEGMGASAAAEAFDSKKLDVEKFRSLGPHVVKDEKLVVRIGHHYFPWDAAAPIILGMTSFGSERIFEAKGMIPIDKNLDGDQSNSSIPSNGNWRIWPFSFRKSRSQKAISSMVNLSEIPIEIDEKVQLYPKVTKKTVKAYAPTSEQLTSLNLKEGRNVVTFTFCTAMLGNQQVDARIYLWKWNTRIVISDVDGTITKSDVLGQFMPLVGIDWSQTGVAHLFSAIKENGYQLLFLSARAISQAFRTRHFLFNLKQDGKALPDGPVFISPDGLFPSLYREVIRRAPHEFKIACLEDIKALFPVGCNPFYAGFGNRYTDEISYRKVGIPKGKIFIINPKGEVAVNRRLDTKSYTSLHALVNGMFPPMNSTEQEDYNAWNYWRLPPPDIDF